EERAGQRVELIALREHRARRFIMPRAHLLERGLEERVGFGRRFFGEGNARNEGDACEGGERTERAKARLPREDRASHGCEEGGGVSGSILVGRERATQKPSRPRCTVALPPDAMASQSKCYQRPEGHSERSCERSGP